MDAPVLSSIMMFIAGYGGSLLGGAIASLFVAWKASGARVSLYSQGSPLPSFYRSLTGDARAASRVQAFGVALGVASALIQFRTNHNLQMDSIAMLLGMACVIAFAISLWTNPPNRSAKRNPTAKKGNQERPRTSRDTETR